ARTIAVIAVLDISIEASIVMHINPMKIRFGVDPEIFNVYLKRSVSNPVLLKADARKNPPNISQITLLEKVFTYFAMFCGSELNLGFPNEKARNARINNPTENAGIASVNHKPMQKNSRNRT